MEVSIHLRGIVILAAAAGLVACALAQTPAAVRQAGKLTLHEPVERELAPGQTDVFTVDVAAGQFLHVLVQKKGVDVVVVLTDSDERPVVTADHPNGAFGPEPASLIADRDGVYQVRVAKSPRSLETGRYQIELTDLRAPTEQDQSRLQAESAFIAAVADNRTRDKPRRLQAIAGYQRAASLWHSLRDEAEEALCLYGIGVIYLNFGEQQRALDHFNQALPLRRALKDAAGEAAVLNSTGNVYVQLGEKQKALDSYTQALALERAAGDRAGEAGTLNGIGGLYKQTGEPSKALEYFNQAVPLWQAGGNRSGEATTVTNIANVYRDIGDKQKALEPLGRALELQRAAGDRSGEARALNLMGLIQADLGEKEKALDYFNQALPLERAVGDRMVEAATLSNIGLVYRGLGEKQKTLDYYNQALAIMRAIGDRSSEARILSNIGVLYLDFGEKQKALDYYNLSLPLMRAAGDRVGEGGTLGNIGGVLSDLGEKRKALEFFNQAIPIQQETGDREGEAETLTSIGETYSDLGDKRKALDYYNQALTLERATGNRSDEAATLNDAGNAYSDLRDRQNALRHFTQALQLGRAVSDPSLQGQALSNLMSYWQADRNPRLAILFGKQGVNQYQDLRRNIQGLDPQLQRSYLATVSKNYRKLADLLIAQGRLTEAEQVLGLLKEQEFFEYVRRDAAEASSVNGRASLNPEEAEADRRYREISDKLAEIGFERGELVAKKTRTQDEAERLDQLEKNIAVSNGAFEKFLRELPERFSAKQVALQDLREQEGIMEDLRELPKGTVAIYTLVGEDKFRMILRTPDIQKAYEYPIKGADLNRKVLDFRQAVQDPKIDPRPLAKDLYKIVVGPMAKDLRSAKAQTLMWSLDGVLRYLPLAALHDGKQYLIEQYGVSVITLASNARLLGRPDTEWKAAGFGVTKAYEDQPSLPWVSGELAGIIASKPGDGGVLAGEIKLDGEFTREAMRQTLLKRYPVVHIASHFRFQPGNETQSFLLLGDGAHLSLAELKTSANLFGGVQLLTLSACNTGMGDGTEVEGFGALAQRQGAKAVIASLWPVADESTSRLMQEFYRIRESTPGVTKLEALRQAQLKLLRGTLKATSAEGADRGVTSHAEKSYSPNSFFSHPYYWAPFFLMGNWL